ncbi:hypothetical protein G6F57_008732 [Rhizopus arrhizus]|nr:hypothetical protein G6F24_009907 [Rhizopus arrhizus]KAG0905882.1 hypothetical protein G6F33_011813 [Rhizopus arrhizus]KAG0928794.1 hypothetical protein G6F32_012469 [Rhizopus arrhizus]KAG0935691.1 hypothetical protein G6F30_009203 [Rhizopus arrhizus]KAG0974074.1 hypothetical protein G6F29_012444 [Rhizopus arrhizus]
MEWVEDVDPFHLETLTTFQKYKQAQPSELLSGVTERTGQQWAKRLKDDPEWNIFEKQTNHDKRKTGMLQQAHKEYIINLYDQRPDARVVDVIESLTKLFENFNLKETSVRNFIRNECNLSFKRATLHPEERNSDDKLQQRFEWINRWAATDMDYMSNCVFVDESGFNINMRSPSAWSTVGAISVLGVLDIELRVAEKPKQRKVEGGRKRKQTSDTKRAKGTKTGYYLNFIRKTLDEMDKNPLMKEVTGAPIFPSYSPELNPIEQFWSVVKNKVKRGVFSDNEDLKTRIAEACNNVSHSSFKGLYTALL